VKGALQGVSLRTRLMLAYAGLIVVGFAGLAVFAGRQMSTAAEEDYENQLEQQAQLMAEGLSDIVGYYVEGRILPADLARFVQGAAERANARLTVMDPDGVVWIDSGGLSSQRDQTQYPEVLAALNGRLVHDLRVDESGNLMIHTAAPIVENGEVLGVVRVTAPARAVHDAVTRRWLALGGSVSLLALIAIAASAALSRSLTRPLERLRVSAERLAEGDLSSRIPVDRADEIGELAAAFNYLAEQVEEMLAEQRAFAANASHELRTPLTAIRLRAEALRSGKLDDEAARRYAAEIDDEVGRMGGLVEDLILLSRLDAGRAEPGNTPVDVDRLARTLMRDLSTRAESAGVDLSLDAPSDLPPVEASPNHLRIVFRNLLDNALKYTPAGGKVDWQLCVDGDYLISTVIDTGQGIHRADLDRLFERFFRADKSRSRRVEGSGLGLSLTCSIVGFYGGQLEVESEGPGQGTTARVRWPLRRADAPTENTSPCHANAPDSSS
jgi:signal transduction histidine kinase